MSPYSGKTHAEVGSATTVRARANQTYTYPAQPHTYAAGPRVDYRVSKGAPLSASDGGRIVLSASRNGNRLDTMAMRSPSFAARARSPSHASAGFSTSFSAAGAALSMSASDRARPANPRAGPLETEAAPMPGARLSATAPTQGTGLDATAQAYGLDAPPPMGEGDEMHGAYAANQLLHKCESCSKIYRHPSCLVKHRWEHTMYWKEASKFLMSKHQQVQLLEAAAILVGMESTASSLPEEKALWPAAVSPPSSGLLGCDHVNFTKLMASKATPEPLCAHNGPAAWFGTSAPTHAMDRAPPTDARRAACDDDMDEERPARDHSSESGMPSRDDAYGTLSGGDVMADMDMEAD